jgi:glycosyltransferase involved in cell wall biosynthesis
MVKACDIPNVEYLGVLPWSDLQQQMKGARCLVHPTLADSSPNVVKEARVIGLPVITTIHGGQAGYIRNGENGIIVEPLNPVSLAEALSRVMDDSQFARRMGTTRHAEDRAYFRPENTARGFLEIYDELLA